MNHLDQAITHHMAALGWPLEAMIRLLLAAMAGAAIGIEREISGRRAGFRTNLLVCFGSALAMIVSVSMVTAAISNSGRGAGSGRPRSDRVLGYDRHRLPGPGMILHEQTRVYGLTSAAAMWCVAAMGLSAGLGLYLITILSVVVVLLTLRLLETVQGWLPRTQLRILTIRRLWEAGTIRQTMDELRRSGYEVMDLSYRRSQDLAYVDIDLRVGFRSHDDFYKVDEALEGMPGLLVLGVREG